MNFYEYFSSDIDSINTLPNGKTYITKGEWYIRYSDESASNIDKGYPMPLVGNWGFSDKIGRFAEGFDSMATLPNGKTYITKGEHYLRYSDENATEIDEGFPKSIAEHWGAIKPDAEFDGFDAMAKLQNGKTYIFKGSQYYRYSDEAATTLDEGYPKPIAGNWGDLPESFESGIDAIASLPNGKTYLFKGDQYVRYSDESCNKIDAGYPFLISKYWDLTSLKEIMVEK